MAARTIRPASFLFGDIAERAAMLVDRASGARLGNILGSSASRSPFGDFGIVVAAGSKPLPVSQAIREVANFTVEEARQRLNSFITGKFVPETVADLLSYMNDRFLRLETRAHPQGNVANYIVDKKTNRSVPAALVDRRLGHRSMLQAALRGAMRRHMGPGDPADTFHSWEAMKLVLSNDPSGIAYSVSNGQGFIGKLHATASNDHAENMAVVRKARARGLELILPTVRGSDGARGNLVAGMPILVRSRSLKAEDINPSLSHDRLSRKWGIGMDTTYAKMAERARLAPNGPGKVVSFEAYKNNRDDFRRRFVRMAEESPAPQPNEAGIGFGGKSSDRRDIVIRLAASGTGAHVFDRDLQEEIMVSIRALPPGRYPTIAHGGRQLGFTDVETGGALRHFSNSGIPVGRKTAAQPPAPDESYGLSPKPGRMA